MAQESESRRDSPNTTPDCHPAGQGRPREQQQSAIAMQQNGQSGPLRAHVESWLELTETEYEPSRPHTSERSMISEDLGRSRFNTPADVVRAVIMSFGTVD
jgi:hypothetical protein